MLQGRNEALMLSVEDLQLSMFRAEVPGEGATLGKHLAARPLRVSITILPFPTPHEPLNIWYRTSAEISPYGHNDVQQVEQ